MPSKKKKGVAPPTPYTRVGKNTRPPFPVNPVKPPTAKSTRKSRLLFLAGLGKKKH